MKKHDGFAMILVLVFSTGLLTLSLATWYQTSILYDLINEREQHCKHTVIAHRFFKATVSMLSKNWHFFMEPNNLKKMPLYFEIKSNNNDQYLAMLHVDKSSIKTYLKIQLIIFKEKKVIKKMSWLYSTKKINNKNVLEMSHVEER